MVYNSLHCLLIERRFDEAKIDVLNDLNKKMVKEPHINGDMPLHIALLLDAPDELVISIYNAYPQAANLNSHDGQTVMEIVKKRRRSAQVKNVLSGKGVNSSRINIHDLRSSSVAIRRSSRKSRNSSVTNVSNASERSSVRRKSSLTKATTVARRNSVHLSQRSLTKLLRSATPNRNGNSEKWHV
mmetsp:Transcript_14696/g.22773  ORF Transcript_14696/g.22773 Transcript_14696/m.22773 type:complete len:185 (-) Transcript_14696:309-863(-)